MDFGTIVGIIGGVLGIAGTLGGVVGWLVDKSNKRIADSITQAIIPLTYEMKALNTHLEANNVEHKGFREMLEDHEDCIHDHDKRITILEKIGGKNYE